MNQDDEICYPKSSGKTKPSTLEFEPKNFQSSDEEEGQFIPASKPRKRIQLESSDEEDYMSELYAKPSSKKPKPSSPTYKPSASIHTPLASDNKGLKMLEKMGYKKGMGLGTDGTGIVDPITVNRTIGKQGLGTQPKPPIPVAPLPPREDITPADYRARTSNIQKQRIVVCDLEKARRTIETLDLGDGKARSGMWLPEDGGEDVYEGSLRDFLEAAEGYLRYEYRYCMYW